MLFGLHYLDIAVIAAFVLMILIIGLHTARGVKGESDFFLGGRKLGKALTFFLNFGNAADPTGAVNISRGVYTTGVGGVWASGFQTLFYTPFFWFTQPWHRRARLTTMADLFTDRFDSKQLASAYAAFNIFIALLTMGLADVSVFKVARAMILKPESAYTSYDWQLKKDYDQYHGLAEQVRLKQLSPDDPTYSTYRDLKARVDTQDLPSTISYVKPLPFYLAYCTIVGIYITMGGLKAAAITDTIQGLLILIMSILLIPLGLVRTGGFAGLHKIVSVEKFHLMNEQTWFSIFGFVLAAFVQVVGIIHNMSTAGSAKDEDTARFGMITGGFTKRIVLVCWTICGLLAVAIITNLSDADLAWGALSNTLLTQGLIGLMLSGMLLGMMPMIGVQAVSVSALITRNLYEPLVPNKTPAHYLKIGQCFIAVVLLLTIVISIISNDVGSLYTNMVTFNTLFGAAAILIYTWKGVTATSIKVGLAVWVLGIILLPSTLPLFDGFTHNPRLLLRTNRFEVSDTRSATAADVASGKATAVGQHIDYSRVVDPKPVFFDTGIVPDHFGDKATPGHAIVEHGVGRFSVENYVLYLLGAPVQNFQPATLIGTRWFFDGLFPFVILMGVSLVTRRAEPMRVERFYAKMRTPVGATPEIDAQEVSLSFENPDRNKDVLLFPGSGWEFKKWSRKDYIGFFGCWVIVLLILGFLNLMLRIGG